MRPEPAPVVVFQNRHLLVVLKPTGLATTAPHGEVCLTQWAEREVHEKLHPTSRLDAEVTGLVTFARTKEAISELRDARKKGRYSRGYIGLAQGQPEPSEGEWEKSIAIDPRDPRSRVALSEGETGTRVQLARTGYRVRAQAMSVSVLWLTPHTGRTHQLRVHAADAGFPLLGDVRYGGPKRVVLGDGRVVTARRTMLHCAWLRIPAVEGPELLTLRANVPDDFAKVWTALGGEPSALEASPDP